MTYLVALLFAYRWVILVGGSLLLVGVLLLLRATKKSDSLMGCIFPVFLLGATGFAIFGSKLSTEMIYANGESGEATVTGSFPTGTLYNEEPVIGFNVLIRTADGKLVKSSYRTDSFNVYPPSRVTIYPSVGARFNIRYVAGHPELFVIVANDDSPWARKRACDSVLRVVATAQQEAQFAGADPSFEAAVDHAIAKAREAGCLK